MPEARGLQVYTVARFKEKPQAAVAQEYFDLGTFYWNSGIFIWKAKTIIAALAQRQPEMLARLQKIVDAWGKPDGAEVFAREFAAIKGISIDYAVMEQAAEVAVIEAPFTWDDVGTWQAAARQAGADAQGNSITGKHLTVDTKGSIIRSDDNHLVATVGVSDLIVVHTPDATLVANRKDEEAIRKIVKLLEEQGLEGILVEEWQNGEWQNAECRRQTSGRLAGIDYGTVRIGIAITDPGQRIASPLAIYTRQDLSGRRGLLPPPGHCRSKSSGSWSGLPVHLDGRESQKSIEARQFGQWLQETTGVSVVFFDERFTTAEAEQILAQAPS